MDAAPTVNPVLYANPTYQFGSGCDTASIKADWSNLLTTIGTKEAHRIAIFAWRTDNPLTTNPFAGTTLDAAGPHKIETTPLTGKQCNVKSVLTLNHALILLNLYEISKSIGQIK